MYILLFYYSTIILPDSATRVIVQLQFIPTHGTYHLDTLYINFLFSFLVGLNIDVIVYFRIISLLLVFLDLILVIADLATPNKSTEV